MTDVTPELEAVAKAIYEADPKTRVPPVSGYPWTQTNDTTREVYRAMARAALLAVREPTEGMLEAVDTSNPDGSNYVEDEWQAMIDHILGGKP